MSEQTDRDALVEVIGGHLPQSRGAGRWPGCFSHPRIEDWTPDHLADVVLASDWLAQRDRRVAAEALREAAEAWHERQVGLHGGAEGYQRAKSARWWLNNRADRIEAGE